MRYIKIYEDFDNSAEFDPFSHVKKNIVPDLHSELLHISSNNAKLKYPYFSLPSGYTCPFADNCKSLVNRKGEKFGNGKVVRDFGQFRCYSANAEVVYKGARNNRWDNFELIKQAKTVDKMAALIIDSINLYAQENDNFSIFRIHEAGDFFSQDYFDAWMKVCKHFKNIKFYSYTKSLPYWVKRLNQIPKNLKLIASKGGKSDELIDKYNLRYCEVVGTVEEAKQKRLRIDVDDTLAYTTNDNFALLLHGSQPAKTEASKNATANAKILRDIKK